MLTWTHSIRVQAQEVNGSGPTGLLDTSLFDLDTDHDSDDDDGEAASSSFFNPWFDNLRSLIAREEEKKRSELLSLLISQISMNLWLGISLVSSQAYSW